MQTRVVLVALLLLALPSVAGPTNGTDLSVDADTWYLHADAESESAWMSNAAVDGQDRYFGWGKTDPNAVVPGVDSVRIDFPLRPALTQDVAIDTDQSAQMTIYVGASDGAGIITVTPGVTVDGETFLLGEALESPYAVEYLEYTWTLTPRLDTLPAGSNAVFSVEVAGAFTAAYVGVHPDVGQSKVTLPVVAASNDDGNEATSTSTPGPTSSTTSTSSTTPTPTSSGTPSPTSSTTSSPTTTGPDDAQGSPSLGVLVALAMLAWLGANIRRRL